ncbi:SRPBCC family protein [Rathayibacter festucae]|uniref:SRPBCC family protein n=1 Tax=Rathayibacter festucae TaxID=110937 RepID=UPI001ABDDD50|nr:SRPBCC family protein [Rathayibacter festucae]
MHTIPEGTVVHFDRELVGAGMRNAVRDRLTGATPETTLWESESEFRFDGFLLRVTGRLLPGVFQKQSQQHMEDFKAFAERGEDVRDD